MLKLSIEDLTVTTFETAAAKPVPTGPSVFAPCYPTDANFDCTFGCSQNTACPDRCILVEP